MKISEQIDELIQALIRRGESIPSSVTLGEDTLKKLKSGSDRCICNPQDETCLRYHTAIGFIEIKFGEDKPADYIGINGRTMLDIIVEEALLEN